MTRSRHNFARQSTGGFTLLELIVAMFMVAILAVTLAASMHIAFNATDSAQQAIEPGRTADLTMELLRGDLENALQPNGVLAGTFEGTQGQDDRGHEADDLIFFSTADSPQHVAANGEIKQIELAVEIAANGDHVLVRRVTRNLLSETQATPDEEVLCRGVWSFSFQYFDGSNWDNTWDSSQEDNTVPAAVRVTLELSRAGAKGTTHTLQFMRSFALPCSTAAQDSAVNTGESTIQ